MKSYRLLLFLGCALVATFSRADAMARDMELARPPVIAMSRDIQMESELAEARRLIESGPKSHFCLAILDTLGALKPKSFEATNTLENLYWDGTCVPANQTKVFGFCQLAASKGSLEDTATLGILYFSGIGTPQNKSYAVQLWEWVTEGVRGAALRDNVKASVFSRLGKAYLNGEGTVQDLIAGREYLVKAAILGNTDAAEVLDTGLKESALANWKRLELFSMAAIAVLIFLGAHFHIRRLKAGNISSKPKKSSDDLLSSRTTDFLKTVFASIPRDSLGEELSKLPHSLMQKLITELNRDVFEADVLSKFSKEEILVLFEQTSGDFQREAVAALSLDQQKKILMRVPIDTLKYLIAQLPKDDQKRFDEIVARRNGKASILPFRRPNNRASRS